MNILIVEDDDLLRTKLAKVLTKNGYTVLENGGREEAIVTIEQIDQLALVITDIQMLGPDDGFMLADWIRVHRPETPIILMSAGRRAAEIASDRYADCIFLEKPFAAPWLLNQVAEALGRSPTSA